MEKIRLRAIASLAILKVNWDRGRDYINNFVPFVLEALRVDQVEAISTPDLQASIAELFSLHIPQGALETIVRRIAKMGHVLKEHGVYVVQKKALSNGHFAEVRDAVLENYELLLAQFASYCQDAYGISISSRQAERALEEYFARGSVDLIMPALRRAAIAMPGDEDSVPEKQIDYLLHRFISEQCKSGTKVLQFLVAVVRGRMLADVLYYPSINQIKQRFGRVKVFLDTTLLLRAVGYSDTNYQTPCVELLELLRNAGLSLHCFEHTYEEVVGILKGDARRLLEDSIAGTHGETLRYFLSQGYTASDIQLEIARLTTKLRSLGIRVERKPRYEKPLGINEQALEDRLLQDVHWRRGPALRRDVDSLAAIFRLRRGVLHSRLENCAAVFVTTNVALAWSTTGFFRDEYGRSITPLCFSDHVMTTLVWLKNPSRSPDLSQKRLIADCYAALNPGDELWKAYAREVEKLRKRNEISFDDYYVLRSTQGQEALMDLTSGDPGAFTQGSTAEVLRRAKETMVADERAKTKEAEARAELAENRVEKLEQVLHAQQQAWEDRVNFLAYRFSKWGVRTVLSGAFILLGLAIYATLPRPLSAAAEQWPKGILFLFAVLLAVLGFVNLWKGVTLNSLLRRLQLRLQKQVSKGLRQVIPPPAEHGAHQDSDSGSG